jgi:hypothetical protein
MGARRNSLGQFGKPRKPPPDLEFRCPDCPLCDKETDTDGDSFVCYPCEASWSMDGTRGSWNDPTELACSAVIEWWNTDRLGAEHESIRHLTEACILPDDHGGKHRSEDACWREWDDDDPRVLKRGAAV